METKVMRHGGSRSSALREATSRQDVAGQREATNRHDIANCQDTANRQDTALRGPRWWQRIRRQFLPSPEVVLDQLNRQLAVLEGARTELEAGWIQGGWWAVGSPDDGRRLVTGLAAAGGRPDRIDGVCLVGALVRVGAGSTGGGAGGDGEASGTGRAVDAVYEALRASRSQETATPPAATPPAGTLPPAAALPPVPPPAVRLARVRTITQWNDRPERTKAEVLTVIDHAISATIMTLMATPAPKAPKAPAPKAPPPAGPR